MTSVIQGSYLFHPCLSHLSFIPAILQEGQGVVILCRKKRYGDIWERKGWRREEEPLASVVLPYMYVQGFGEEMEDPESLEWPSGPPTRMRRILATRMKGTQVYLQTSSLWNSLRSQNLPDRIDTTSTGHTRNLRETKVKEVLYI